MKKTESELSAVAATWQAFRQNSVEICEDSLKRLLYWNVVHYEDPALLAHVLDLPSAQETLRDAFGNCAHQRREFLHNAYHRAGLFPQWHESMLEHVTAQSRRVSDLSAMIMGGPMDAGNIFKYLVGLVAMAARQEVVAEGLQGFQSFCKGQNLRSPTVHLSLLDLTGAFQRAYCHIDMMIEGCEGEMPVKKMWDVHEGNVLRALTRKLGVCYVEQRDFDGKLVAEM